MTRIATSPFLANWRVCQLARSASRVGVIPIVLLASACQTRGQPSAARPPIIDMHLHPHSLSQYGGGMSHCANDQEIVVTREVRRDHTRRVSARPRVYTYGIDQMGGIVSTTAKLFKNGRSQAVRLPREFRFEGDRVRVRRAGRGVLVEPVATDVTAWFAELDRLASEPFMPEGRQQPPTPERDVFE